VEDEVEEVADAVSSLLSAPPSLLPVLDVDKAAEADVTDVEEVLAVEVVSIEESAVAKEELEAVLSSEE
jgi:hypothetical protein